ncbi:MAG: FAD-dependent oxidoreductase [Actinobacteria bacterium]|nr:MAG: FAD-dependent oxidoreductase [Actinomycetota bacterium]
MDVVVIGAGLAGARVVESYREAGGGGSVAIVGAELHPPYHRPPLTKRILRGEAEPADALVRAAVDYRALDVDLRLDTAARALDLRNRRVELAGGEAVAFERLVIATGALPRRLPVPGVDLSGVFTLRTLDDSLAVRAAAANADRAVVIGTGFIGLEVAASLRSRGLEVTIVDVAPAPFATLGAPVFSDYLVELYREQGIEMLLEDGVAAFAGDGALSSVVTASGRTLPAQLAVVGVGVAPATGWLEGCGLELENGVVVDSSYRSSADGVYAAGDVASFVDPVFGRRRRIEHWSNADYQGRALGRILAGIDEPYDRVSTFFTELFGTAYKFFGDSAATDHIELEGDFRDGRAVVRYYRGGDLHAALLTGQSEEREGELQERIRSDALAATA